MSATKRPRLTGSFSPASPPYHLAKGVEHTKPLGGFQQPNTPTSPPPQPMTSIPANASTASTANTQLSETTPASTASASYPTKDGDGDATMIDDTANEAVAAAGAQDGSAKAERHIRTDHERIQDGLKLAGEREQMREFLLYVDVRPFYKLSEQPTPQLKPYPSRNMFDLFDLNPLAKSVERNDPVTGEKTNKLRKSYENQIKSLGISGRNKAVNGQNEFDDLVEWPAEEYYIARVNGKSLDSAMNNTTGLDARLRRALRVPAPQAKLTNEENERWRTLIATDESARPLKAMEPPSQRAQHAVHPTGLRKSAHGAIRPERSNKKRSYEDSSFSGYCEGYVDDRAVSSEDDKALAARRKRARAV